MIAQHNATTLEYLARPCEIPSATCDWNAAYAKLRIGDAVYTIDANKRVYATHRPGLGGAPLWRGHWRKQVIIDETRVSWLIGSESLAKRGLLSPREIRDLDRIPKKGPVPSGFALDERHLDELYFVQLNQYHVARKIERVRDLSASTLLEIARLLGMTVDEFKRDFS